MARENDRTHQHPAEFTTRDQVQSRITGPAVDPICPRCRQPVYPGYGTAADDAEFVHFDCLRRKG